MELKCFVLARKRADNDHACVLVKLKSLSRMIFKIKDSPSFTIKFFQNLLLTFCLMPLSYTGNPNLHKDDTKENHKKIIIGSSVGAAALFLATVISCILMRKGKKSHTNKGQIEHFK